MDLLILLILSNIGAACMTFHGGPLLVLWSFRIRKWVHRQRIKRTTKRPRLSVVWPCPSSKVSKDQKDHACNTAPHGHL